MWVGDGQSLPQGRLSHRADGFGKVGGRCHARSRLDAEIIAMDSMTLYRGMDIGTAKPTLAERGECRIT